MKKIIKRILLMGFLIVGINASISSEASAANIIYTDKEIYKPGETITVTYIVDSTSVFGRRPWVGLLTSNISHGSEYTNDCNDIAYCHVSGKSEVLKFTAPSTLGTYDFRLHDTDYSGIEIATSDVFKVSNENTVSVSSVSLDKSNLALKIGEKENMTAFITPENATNKRVLWSSSDPSIASVNSEGEITALKEGVTNIICTTINGRKTSICKVCVSRSGGILDIDSNKSFINLGEEVEFGIFMKNIDSISSEDMIIEYDSSKLQFSGISNADGVRILKKVKSDGKIRIVCSNKNIDSNIKTLLANLKFKSLGTGATSVKISSAKMSNGNNKLLKLDESQLAEKIVFVS